MTDQNTELDQLTAFLANIQGGDGVKLTWQNGHTHGFVTESVDYLDHKRAEITFSAVTRGPSGAHYAWTYLEGSDDDRVLVQPYPVRATAKVVTQWEEIKAPSIDATEPVTTEWRVHVTGMDDVLDALDRDDAYRRAHKVNGDFLAYEAVRERTDTDHYRPTVWAVPLHSEPQTVTVAQVEADWAEWNR
ncbi:hypothetical protein [Nocardia aurea]|uniref:hypothetical protein n=1 Tax=Nocardia aurea TaxID=2144174 RepID=UPI0033AAFCE8